MNKEKYLFLLEMELYKLELEKQQIEEAHINTIRNKCLIVNTPIISL